MSIDELLANRRAAGVLVRLSSQSEADLTTLKDLFDSEAGSRGAVLATSRRRSRGGGTSESPSPMLVFPKLGLAYGAVTRDGLEAMRKHHAVRSVTESNSLRMIRPVPYLTQSAQDTPGKGPTWGIKALKIEALWSQGLTGKGVLVGHLDTGIDGAHPMLEGAIEKATMFDLAGVEKRTTNPPTDSGHHGTHTAGIIAGRPFKQVKAGVAPGAKLLSAEVLEAGDSIARVLGGMEWALTNGARILNLSLGWPTYTDSFLTIVDALRANECLPVIATGNDGEGSTRSPGNYAQSLSVGAVSQFGRVPTFSGSEVMNRPNEPIVPDIVAPGVDIWSAAPGDGFQMLQGTSQATPHVAGLAALLMEAHPRAPIGLVEAAIIGSAKRHASVSETRAGRGMPDAEAALRSLAGLVNG